MEAEGAGGRFRVLGGVLREFFWEMRVVFGGLGEIFGFFKGFIAGRFGRCLLLYFFR